MAHPAAKPPYYQEQSNEVALYTAAYAARLPVMLKGPTGCGKSRFVEYMAWKLAKPLITVACNEDMTASDLVGRYLLDASGTRWLDGPLTLAARVWPAGPERGWRSKGTRERSGSHARNRAPDNLHRPSA